MGGFAAAECGFLNSKARQDIRGVKSVSAPNNQHSRPKELSRDSSQTSGDSFVGDLIAGIDGDITKPSDNIVRVWTDGACRNNGRRGARAGWGVCYGPGDPRNRCGPLEEGPHTNQRAELTAIQKALKYNGHEKFLEINTDSMYAKNCITEWYRAWQANGWLNSRGRPVANKQLIVDILDRIASRKRAYGPGSTTFVWIKGHGGDQGNQMADFLARRGATL